MSERSPYFDPFSCVLLCVLLSGNFQLIHLAELYDVLRSSTCLVSGILVLYTSERLLREGSKQPESGDCPHCTYPTWPGFRCTKFHCFPSLLLTTSASLSAKRSMVLWIVWVISIFIYSMNSRVWRSLPLGELYGEHRITFHQTHHTCSFFLSHGSDTKKSRRCLDDRCGLKLCLHKLGTFQKGSNDMTKTLPCDGPKSKCIWFCKLVESYVEYNIVAICDDNLISSSHYHLDLSASDWHRSAVSTEYSGSQWLPVLDCIRMNVRGRMQQDMSQERFGQLHQQYNLLMLCRVATINFWIHLAPSERTLITAPGGWWHLSGHNMQQRIIKANRIAVRVAARKDKSSAVGRHCAIFASIAPKQS